MTVTTEIDGSPETATNQEDAHDGAVSFDAARRIPDSLRIPVWVAVGIGAATVGGIATGFAIESAWPRRLARGVFLGSAMGYLTASLVDFAEHFRLEKEATGRYMGFVVVPPGESANHVATVAVLVGILGLSRREPRHTAMRDWFVLAAPAVFLALGWRDEFVYHRRRSAHREDIMHTVSHLAAAAMLGSFAALARMRPRFR